MQSASGDALSERDATKGPNSADYAKTRTRVIDCPWNGGVKQYVGQVSHDGGQTWQSCIATYNLQHAAMWARQFFTGQSVLVEFTKDSAGGESPSPTPGAAS